MAISKGKKSWVLLLGGPYNGCRLLMSGKDTLVFSVNGMRGRYVNARWEDV